MEFPINRTKFTNKFVLTNSNTFQRHTKNEKVKHDLRVTSSNPRVTSSNLRVKTLKARFARLKAQVGKLKPRVTCES